MQHLHSQLSSSGKESSSPYFLFNNVITQLLGPFPNTILLNLLMEKTQEVGLEDQFVEKIFSHLEVESYYCVQPTTGGIQLSNFQLAIRCRLESTFNAQIQNINEEFI